MNADEILDQLLHRALRGDEELRQNLVAQHNSSEISIFGLLSNARFQELKGMQFFQIQQDLCDLIPELDGTAEQMTSFTQMLATMGGEDLAATRPNAALRSWFAIRKKLAKATIENIRLESTSVQQNLVFALEGLSDEATCWRLALSEEREFRLSALLALGRGQISISDVDSAARNIEQLIVEGLDDHALGHLLVVAHRLVTGAPEHCSCLQSLMRHSEPVFGDYARHVLADLIASEVFLAVPDLFQLGLMHLMQVSPEHGGTLQKIELAFSSLLDTPLYNEIVSFVIQFVLNAKEFRQKRPLNSLFMEMLLRPRILGLLVANGLGTEDIDGSVVLGQALVQAINPTEPPVEIDFGEIEMSSVQRLNIISRVTGHFFYEAVLAAKAVIAVANGSDDVDVHKHAVQMIMDPLLSNFAGDLLHYLERAKEAGDPNGIIEQAVSNSKAHMELVRQAPELLELSPSERRSQIAQNLQADAMNEAHEDARKQSPFLSLVATSILLYGSRSLSYKRVPDGNGDQKLQPFETALQSIGHSFEIPRDSIFDERGLELKLFSLRQTGFHLR